MKKVILSSRLFNGQKPKVYLKGNNILGYEAGKKGKLHDFNGERFSVVIDGKWYGYYSEDTFELPSVRFVKENAGAIIFIGCIIASFFMI